MPDISEISRRPSPIPHPQGLAIDGTTLWLTGCEAPRLYEVDMATWAVRDETLAPGEPFGVTMDGNELRVVIGCGNDADDRYVYRFTPKWGFENSGIECPDLSGSYLAHDARGLFLSQAWNKKILALDAHGGVASEISLARRPVGMAIVDERFYLMTTDDDWGNLEFAVIEVWETPPRVHSLASVPFRARGLAFDGAMFWTNHRDASEIVAFEDPRSK